MNIFLFIFLIDFVHCPKIGQNSMSNIITKESSRNSLMENNVGVRSNINHDYRTFRGDTYMDTSNFVENYSKRRFSVSEININRSNFRSTMNYVNRSPSFSFSNKVSYTPSRLKDRNSSVNTRSKPVIINPSSCTYMNSTKNSLLNKASVNSSIQSDSVFTGLKDLHKSCNTFSNNFVNQQSINCSNRNINNILNNNNLNILNESMSNLGVTYVGDSNYLEFNNINIVLKVNSIDTNTNTTCTFKDFLKNERTFLEGKISYLDAIQKINWFESLKDNKIIQLIKFRNKDVIWIDTRFLKKILLCIPRIDERRLIVLDLLQEKFLFKYKGEEFQEKFMENYLEDVKLCFQNIKNRHWNDKANNTILQNISWLTDLLNLVKNNSRESEKEWKITAKEINWFKKLTAMNIIKSIDFNQYHFITCNTELFDDFFSLISINKKLLEIVYKKLIDNISAIHYSSNLLSPFIKNYIDIVNSIYENYKDD